LGQREDEGYITDLEPDAAGEHWDARCWRRWPAAGSSGPATNPNSSRRNGMRCYRNWLREMMRRYGHKSEREAYSNMAWCRVERSEGKITIKPHKRDKPEYWTDLPPESTVVIPATVDAAAAGAAVRLALSRSE
jgi:hypothetical protein